MTAFPIHIDATQLVYREFVITGITGWISSREVQTLSLDPGTYVFQVGSGYLPDFSFRVAANGTIDYDANFDEFLAGRGSSTLTLIGFPVTIDARYLSGYGVLLSGMPMTEEDWISYKSCRMVPASYYAVQVGSGEGAGGIFKLGLDGKFAYDPSYDISRGGFLAGDSTSTLQFLGYPLLVDARRAGGAGVAIQPISGMPFSYTSVQFANLLPARFYGLQINSGVGTNAGFSLDVHGTFRFDSSLASYLQLQKFHNLTLLKVLAPLVLQ